MKRITAVLLLLSLLFSGCAEHMKEPVTFYYVRSNYQEDMTEIITSEKREASGHRDDLSYLMALYFMGPTEEGLRSPVPRGTTLYKTELVENTVILNISDTEKTMTDSEFTLACACLTLTCLELTDAQSVTINSGDRSVTMGADALILQDTADTAIMEESTQ